MGGSDSASLVSFLPASGILPSLVQRAGDVLGWIRDGKIKLRVEHQFPLAEAAEAHRALEGRRTTGKILLIPA